MLQLQFSVKDIGIGGGCLDFFKDTKAKSANTITKKTTSWREQLDEVGVLHNAEVIITKGISRLM